jgi:hypothetical protein
MDDAIAREVMRGLKALSSKEAESDEQAQEKPR